LDYLKLNIFNFAINIKFKSLKNVHERNLHRFVINYY